MFQIVYDAVAFATYSKPQKIVLFRPFHLRSEYCSIFQMGFPESSYNSHVHLIDIKVKNLKTRVPLTRNTTLL